MYIFFILIIYTEFIPPVGDGNQAQYRNTASDFDRHDHTAHQYIYSHDITR